VKPCPPPGFQQQPRPTRPVQTAAAPPPPQQQVRLESLILFVVISDI
jgi:hypothetical protein